MAVPFCKSQQSRPTLALQWCYVNRAEFGNCTKRCASQEVTPAWTSRGTGGAGGTGSPVRVSCCHFSEPVSSQEGVRKNLRQTSCGEEVSPGPGDFLPHPRKFPADGEMVPSVEPSKVIEFQPTASKKTAWERDLQWHHSRDHSASYAEHYSASASD